MCDIPLRTEAQKPQFPLSSIWKNVSRGKKQRNSNSPSLSLWRWKHRKPWFLSLQFGRMFPKDGTSCLCSASGDFLIWISISGIICFSSQKVFFIAFWPLLWLCLRLLEPSDVFHIWVVFWQAVISLQGVVIFFQQVVIFFQRVVIFFLVVFFHILERLLN